MKHEVKSLDAKKVGSVVLNKNIFGLQFHPESIGTKNGKRILMNFLKIINYVS